MMFGLGEVTWLRFVFWMAAGFVIYFAYGRFHSKVALDSTEQTRATAS